MCADICAVNLKPKSIQQAGRFLCVDIYMHDWDY